MNGSQAARDGADDFIQLRVHFFRMSILASNLEAIFLRSISQSHCRTSEHVK